MGPPRVQVIRTPLEFLYDIRQRVATLGDDGGGLIVLARERQDREVFEDPSSPLWRIFGTEPRKFEESGKQEGRDVALQTALS